MIARELANSDLQMNDTPLKIQYLRVNFVGLAMIGSVFIYALVVEVLKRTLAPFTGFGGLHPGRGPNAEIPPGCPGLRQFLHH